MEKNMKIRQFALAFAAVLLFAVCVLPKQVCAAGVLDKYKDAKVYNVTEYGVDNTGKKNINAALDEMLRTVRKAINNNELEGKKALIYFPGGTYKCTAQISVREGMILAAEKDTVMKFSGGGLLKVNAPSGSSVEGGTWISSMKQPVIGVSDTKNIEISNLNVQSGVSGIKIRGGKALIENVSVSKCLNGGLVLTGKANVTVKKSKFNNNGHANKTDETAHGIGVYEDSKLTITDSQLNKNRRCGISLKKGNAVIKNCKLNENGRHGLGTRDVCKVEMTNCDIYKNGFMDNHDGAILVQGSTGKFVNCKFRSNAVTGLLINDSKTKASLKGCTFSGNVAHNIYSQNTGSGKVSVTIDGCSFSKCKAGDSVMFYVNKKTGYSLTLKGKNTYKNVKPKYTFRINGKFSYKN